MDMFPSMAPTWRRRSVRLHGYDYRTPGAYFVTICTESRARILGRISDGTFIPSPLGEIAASTWIDLPNHFPHLEVDAYVIMPNHVHGILCIADDFARQAAISKDGERRFGEAVSGSLSTVVAGYKSASARRINEAREMVGESVWQPGFHERIIRSDCMLNAIREYIANNPGNWERDAENAGQ
ncbi:MAG TPA: transposase [Armatimonadota bacterium]|jgi:REP element-mobilizing transposase RayT